MHLFMEKDKAYPGEHGRNHCALRAQTSTPCTTKKQRQIRQTKMQDTIECVLTKMQDTIECVLTKMQDTIECLDVHIGTHPDVSPVETMHTIGIHPHVEVCGYMSNV